MIRIGAVGETAYDGRAEAAQPVLPRPRAAADGAVTGSPPRR
jgi:hypothetical protein